MKMLKNILYKIVCLSFNALHLTHLHIRHLLKSHNAGQIMVDYGRLWIRKKLTLILYNI